MMKAAEIKVDLFIKVDSLKPNQLKQVYGIVQNYLNGLNNVEEWEHLSCIQKQKLEEGIEQSNQGLTRPLLEITTRLRKKYKLNG